jgi:hypothetical protein
MRIILLVNMNLCYTFDVVPFIPVDCKLLQQTLLPAFCFESEDTSSIRPNVTTFQNISNPQSRRPKYLKCDIIC